MRVRARAKATRANEPGRTHSGLLCSLSHAQKVKQPPTSPVAARRYQSKDFKGPGSSAAPATIWGWLMFMDNSIQLIKNSVNLESMRAICTRDYGEIISGDAY
jgi:hypothetical protein